MRIPKQAIIATAAVLVACGAPPSPSDLPPTSSAPRAAAAVPTQPSGAVPGKPSIPPPVAAGKPAVIAPKAVTPTQPATAAAAKPASPPPQAAAPRLDLKSLEQRLKESDAIGVMTKLSLKNQVDDIVSRFRRYHAGSQPPTLDQLRPSFDLLLMKVLSLLQDKDPKLASDIHASRDAIWSVLADPAKLAQFS